MPYATKKKANACQRRWYSRNRAKQIAAVTKRKRQVVAWFRKFKATLSCPCGEDDPRCLDFHHRDPVSKKQIVSVLAHGGSMRALLEEIAKCDVRCCNCHRKETFPI
jgi:hypothetical protein